MRICLVEDDLDLGKAIQIGLTSNGYVVNWITDGRTALQILTSPYEFFDVVILDLKLPKVHGLEILKKIRVKNITTPVIILTAHTENDNEINGLDYGADDFMAKDFELRTLCARIRALRRRVQSRGRLVIKYKNITLDPSAHQITVDSESITLSRREFSLLHKLLENIGRVLSREQLNQSLYGWGESIDSNALEVHIHNIRKRFGNDLIRTIRGIGYMIEQDKNAE